MTAKYEVDVGFKHRWETVLDVYDYATAKRVYDILEALHPENTRLARRSNDERWTVFELHQWGLDISRTELPLYCILGQLGEDEDTETYLVKESS